MNRVLSIVWYVAAIMWLIASFRGGEGALEMSLLCLLLAKAYDK